jgi:large subunit ribosomal protein L21
MFAIIQLGANQYKVSEGDTIESFRLKEEEGKSFDVDKVLLFSDGEKTLVGQPFLPEVKVTAKVLALTQDERKVTFKFRKRKESKRTVGHRQQLTLVSITKITSK